MRDSRESMASASSVLMAPLLSAANAMIRSRSLIGVSCEDGVWLLCVIHLLCAITITGFAKTAHWIYSCVFRGELMAPLAMGLPRAQSGRAEASQRVNFYR